MQHYPKDFSPAEAALVLAMPPLRFDETVLWTGRTSTLRTLERSDIFWSLNAVFGAFAVPLMNPPYRFWGLMAWWILCTLFCLSPILMRRLFWRKATYVLTSERAIIVGGSASRPVQERELGASIVTVRRVRRDCSGTLSFPESNPTSPTVWLMPFAAQVDPRFIFDFVAIPQVEDVAARATSAQLELR